ncbi:oligosaccharide flippase family protein [Polaribacter sejongensis]|uniref:oligosaccharide flippase family protein n=1 Tax=Polaribacter sejongensis TaxID=985043 RepID=UPI001AD80162|nr:oligosaccharide flippase family protein [Polaribacter sejongensis]
MVKATSILGGVQFFQIIIQIVRSKFIAIFLGTTGMGIASLLNSTLDLIGAFTNLGLNTSAIKNVSVANASGDVNKVGTIVTVLRKLIWFTGILGTIITLIFSSWLSEFTFGNSEFSFAFMWISITLLFKQLTTGQLVILQGLHKINYLAKANLVGSLIGLIVTVPLYYFFQIDAIVPAIIITSIISLIVSKYFSLKVDVTKVKVSGKKTIEESKAMVEMGVMISLNGIFTMIAAYFLKIYISNIGGVEIVGLYTAGFAIVNTYVGMIFSAMATDYYPRLSAVNTDNDLVQETVEQQALIVLLILIPIIVVFLIFSPLLIQFFYSNKFIPIVQMVNFAIIGMAFRAVSWSLGFILLAKGESKLLIKTGVGFNTVFFLCNISGYMLMGLTGIGISFIVNYIIHLLGMLLITKYKYSFFFSLTFYKVFLVSLLICFIGLGITFVSNSLLRYPLGIVLIISTIYYSFIELDKRLNLREIYLNFRLKNNK